MLEFEDDRKISEIAEEMEGCGTIRRESEEEGDAVYVGFTRIRSIARTRRGTVQITLMQEGSA